MQSSNDAAALRFAGCYLEALALSDPGRHEPSYTTVEIVAESLEEKAAADRFGTNSRVADRSRIIRSAERASPVVPDYTAMF
jgi:hypothetical protein